MGRTKKINQPAAVNPKDEGVDLTHTIREVVTRLNNEPDIQRRGATHLLPGSMTDRLKQLNLLEFNQPYFLQIFQELNLLSAYGAGKTTTWRVIDTAYIDEYVDRCMVEAARKRVARHNDLVDSKRKLAEAMEAHKQRTTVELDGLREQLKEAKKASKKGDPAPTEVPDAPPAAAGPTDETVTAMAEMVAAIKDQKLRIGQLNATLAEKQSPAQVAAALIEQFREIQAS